MRKYKVKKDSIDNRDIHYSKRHTIDVEALPGGIDFRNKCSPIVDQGELGACTSNAIVSGLREYILLNNERTHFERLSRIYLYWWERYRNGNVYQDVGASLRDGMIVLQKNGVCTEKTRPYNIQKFAEVPKSNEINEAKRYLIPGYQRLNSIHEVKHALYNDHPVVFSMTIYQSFEHSVGSDGIVSIPQVGEQEAGGHAMCIVGYKDTQNGGFLIARNSWGTNWGDDGYCYIPYTMSKYIMDAWTVKYGNI